MRLDCNSLSFGAIQKQNSSCFKKSPCIYKSITVDNYGIRFILAMCKLCNFFEFLSYKITELLTFFRIFICFSLSGFVASVLWKQPSNYYWAATTLWNILPDSWTEIKACRQCWWSSKVWRHTRLTETRLGLSAHPTGGGGI